MINLDIMKPAGLDPCIGQLTKQEVRMKASAYLREGIEALRDLIHGICGWLLIAPLAALVPKRRDWVAVIGREEGRFLDNTKYFFLGASLNGPPGLRIVHVTGLASCRDALKQAGLPCLRYPSLPACWFLLRCGTAVVDSTEWGEKWRCFLLCRARVMQLWHGVGFKRIELDKWRNESSGRDALVTTRWLLWLRLLRKWIRGRLCRYDAVVTTSTFYRDKVFRHAFRSRDFPVLGYPRNAFYEMPSNVRGLAWMNVDPLAAERARTWHTEGRKLVLVAPTFRDTRATSLALNSDTTARIDAFCARHGYEILFKFHPYEKGSNRVAGSHLHVLDTFSDVYPIFPYLSALVTDYSSIYMDFLLLNRPVLFLTPDLGQYIASDRGIQFDYEQMTPGPKVDNWPQLLDQLLRPDDAWRLRRVELRDLAFGTPPYPDATSEILRYMSCHGWFGMGTTND